MKERLVAKGARPERIEVIPNWVDVDALTPQPKDNEWAQEQGLVDKFVVMHSGNIGHAQNLDVLMDAATRLDDLDRLSIVLIGTGARLAHTRSLANQLGADRVSFLPYQPRERISLSLSTADVHFLGLTQGLAGFVVPSRLYGILAAGRPILAAVDRDSETSALVQEIGCGLVIPPARPDLVAEAIRSLARGDHDLEEMGRKGRAYVETHGSLDSAVARYRQLLLDVRT